MRSTTRWASLRLAVLVPTVAAGQALPRTSPESARLTTAGVARLDSAMQAYVSGGKLPGLVIAVARDGKVAHWKAFGLRRTEPRAPMEPNDLFRIYSMTKPITSAAIMMLVDGGQLELDDPVAKHITAFGGVKVWTSSGLVAPHRPMTVRDLLRHTSGLTYGLFGETPVDSLYRRANLQNPKLDLQGLVTELAKLPLIGHPGEVWNYGYRTDVLGRLVEIASGMPLDRFFEDRIFRPLGMKDTFFEVPADKRGRFTGYYARIPSGGFLLSDSPDTGGFTRRPKLLSGGGGLVSTATDYLRFAQMMLNGGELDGVRLLRRETAESMSRNQLPDALIPLRVGSWVLEGTGFGFGFSVLVRPPDRSEGPAGRAGWGGYANTFFWIDPANRLIGLILTQFFPFQAYPIEEEFRRLVYQALVGAGASPPT